jgi:ankyrin repeat protein
VGFGVERDHAQILRFIDEAATYGCFEARRIRNQLYRAFSVPLCPLDVLVRVDELGERQLQYLQEAELQNADVNAFQVFDDVAQEDFRSRLSTTMISLHHAAYIGDLGRVRHLLDSQQDFQDEKGRTALFWAVKGRQMGAMRLLLDVGGGDPQIADEDGHTPVHMLIMFSNLEVEAALSRMLELSRNLDLDRYSPTPLDASEHWAELWGAPLHWAVLAGNKAMVSCLVKAGARVHGWPEESCPVRIAASLHLSEILEILLSAIPHESPILGTNPLFALTSGDPFRRLMLHGKDYIPEIDRTVALLANRYPVVAEDGGPWNGNPLRELLVSNFSDSDQYIAKALVAAGAAEDPYNGLTLLQSAIIGCHGSPASSVCRMALDMIEVEDDLRRRSTDHRQGWTALHWAAAGGMVPVADKLLRLDPESINLRTEEDEDRTPLHLAAEAGKSIDMIRLLLRHGADTSLTTSGLKLTPLGSFISNQRSELNSEILTVLLRASRDNGYLVMRSDSWNVLHFGATRAALLDAESLPGHVLLRTFATIPEMRELVTSTTAQGWTPLQLASYMVDYSTIKVLVEDFGADVQAATPNGARPFDIVLERGRRFPIGLRGADSLVRWSRLAFRSALFLQQQLETLEGPLHLTPLHIAAYIGHQREVERLVRTNPQAVFETNWEDETPWEMLQNTLPSQVDEEWAATFCRVANSVLKYLDEKELELEEDLE